MSRDCQRKSNIIGQQQSRPNVVRMFDGLSKEVVEKINQVDRDGSTLTTSGIKGFSARIIEKTHYQQSSVDRAGLTCYNLLIEIIKKPGQTLGLYLREGNGEGRSDGVFVSRLAETGELIKSDVLKKGDEILTINHVDISRMCLDDVVIMMSIPKRLLLQTIRKECHDKLKPSLKFSAASDPRRQVYGTGSKSIESAEIGRTPNSVACDTDERLKKQRSLAEPYYTPMESKYLRSSPKRINRVTAAAWRSSAPIVIEQENFKVQEYYPNLYPINSLQGNTDFNDYQPGSQQMSAADIRRHLWRTNENNLTKSNSLPKQNNLSVIPYQCKPSIDDSLNRILNNYGASSAPELRSDMSSSYHYYPSSNSPYLPIDSTPYQMYHNSVQYQYTNEKMFKNVPRLYRCISNPYYPTSMQSVSSKSNQLLNNYDSMQFYAGDKLSSDAKNIVVSPSLTGLLIFQIIEGRGLHVSEKYDSHEDINEEMYCVIQIDGDHRARTEVSSRGLGFHWNETFEIDVWDCKQADFYIYSWHPLHRRTLRHRGRLRLPEALITGRLKNQEQCFALCLEPKGQLLIRVGFHSMLFAYRRPVSNRRNAYWGVPLSALVFRENGFGSPILLRRMLGELEQRGIDVPGLYLMCASLEKKMSLRHQLELQPSLASLDSDAVPDPNLITTLIKDFLRELPEPVVPDSTYQLLVDTWRVLLPNNKEENAKLILGVLDCLPVEHKSTFIILMDHLKYVVSYSTQSGLAPEKLSRIFGPLLFCSCRPTEVQSKRVPINYLDHRLAGFVFEVLMDLWPFRLNTNTAINGANSENGPCLERYLKDYGDTFESYC